MITKFRLFENISNDNIIDIIKNSTLCEYFKDELIRNADDDDEAIDIDEDAILHFLEDEGINIDDLSEDDEIKNLYYIRQHFSDNLKNFPKIILNEDNYVIYDPKEKFNYTKDELPKVIDIDDDLYVLYLYLIGDDKHENKMFYTIPLSLEKCEELEKIFKSKNITEIGKNYEFFNELSEDNFYSKIDMIKKDMSIFVEFRAIIKKATKQEMYDSIKNKSDKYNL